MLETIPTTSTTVLSPRATEFFIFLYTTTTSTFIRKIVTQSSSDDDSEIVNSRLSAGFPKSAPVGCRAVLPPLVAVSSDSSPSDVTSSPLSSSCSVGTVGAERPRRRVSGGVSASQLLRERPRVTTGDGVSTSSQPPRARDCSGEGDGVSALHPSEPPALALRRRASGGVASAPAPHESFSEAVARGWGFGSGRAPSFPPPPPPPTPASRSSSWCANISKSSLV